MATSRQTVRVLTRVLPVVFVPCLSLLMAACWDSPSAPEPSVSASEMRSMKVEVRGDADAAVTGVVVKAWVPGKPSVTPVVQATTDGNGIAALPVPAEVTRLHLWVTAEGYLEADQAAAVDAGAPVAIRLSREHVDPSRIALAELAAIRGAMWTVPGPWPYGPRPGEPDNVTAMEYLYTYGSDPARLTDTQKGMLAAYKGEGYTHVAFGPPVGKPYHDLWPSADWTSTPERFDRWLDWVQVFWDHGLTPVVFLHPDNADLDATRRLYDPLIRNNPRARRLLRVIVPSGWEPTVAGWSSTTWTRYAKWGRQLLPNALDLIHTGADTFVPAGTDAHGRDEDTSRGKSWKKIAPYIHGWLVQSNAFEHPDAHGDANHPTSTNFDNWAALFDRHVSWSLYNRFHHGYAGWPTDSAWGKGQPLRVYAGEYCSYWVTWHHRRYDECLPWGDRATRVGADGYLDGGTVPVPAKE